MFAIFGSLVRFIFFGAIAAAIVIVIVLSRGTRRFGGSRGRSRMNADQPGSSRSYANSTRSNYHGPTEDPVEVPIIEVKDVSED